MINSKQQDIGSLIKKGRYFAAFNEAERALHDDPSNYKLRQHYGLCLSKLGMFDKARTFLWDLHQNYPDDPETAGILGGVLKNIFKRTGSREEAILSRDIYLDNYRKNKSYYTGINAASMSVVVGDHAAASGIAGEIVGSLPQTSDDFWELVTLGEAYLLRGDTDRSFTHYHRAKSLVERDHGMFSSVYAQLILLANYLEVPEEISLLYKPDSVVVFTGHMIDQPDRPTKRFPDEITRQVASRIAEILDKISAGIGYCSVACGADILFVEEMLKRKAEVNLFLPYNMHDFLKTSVDFAGPAWRERFDKIVESQPVHYITEEGYFGNDDLHALLGHVIFGKTQLRAESLKADPVLLTVLTSQGKPGEAPVGGTEYLVSKWPDKDAIYRIDPREFLADIPLKKATPVIISTNDQPEQVVDRDIRHILFADVVGYSKIKEDKTPFFVRNLLTDISSGLEVLDHSPEILNTWGDSIFAVYQDIHQIMEFALALQRSILDSNKIHQESDIEFSMRIALHTGPVFLLDDPITRRKNAFGSHINRAARMEPVTNPGSIYASDQFASVLKFECHDEFHFEYVGIIDLPKEFGRQEMYRVTRSTEI